MARANQKDAVRLSGVTYTMPLLNGQPAILAHYADGQPFYAIFLYGEASDVQLIYVVAGRKLAALAS